MPIAGSLRHRLLLSGRLYGEYALLAGKEGMNSCAPALVFTQNLDEVASTKHLDTVPLERRICS